MIEETTIINGVEYRHEQTFKADSIAATRIYKSSQGAVVVKTGRPHRVLLLLARPAARYLVRREVAIGKRLEGLEGIPRVLEYARPLTFVREYVPGHVLDKHRPVDDDFFDRLLVLLKAMHRRGVVHVDIEKPENILVGDDGRPYLIDFQISFCIHHVPGLLRPLTRPVFHRLVRADLYHFYKHKRRNRPDLTTPQEQSLGRRGGWPIRVHRFLTRPYFYVRRKFVTVRGEALPTDVDSK